jgi:branched-chain amino acid transport system ATP-binding protein
MSISADDALLEVKGLQAGYGKVAVLHEVDLAIAPREVVALLGPNGAGKTTLLRAISGLITADHGGIHFDGRDLTGMGPRACVRAGLIHVIEGHRIFTQMTVDDNLLIAAYDIPRPARAARIEEALSFFPELGDKRHNLGGSLSGGQQQMLAVAQGLVQRPKLLMLDEPSAGLSPVLVDRVLAVVRRLREGGTAVLLVEQLVEKALSVSDRVLVLSQGRLVLEAPAQDETLPRRIEEAYFGHTIRAA